MSKRIIQILALALAGVVLLAAGLRSFRLAAADWLYRRATNESAHAAIRLEPGNALYHAGLAELLALSGADAALPLRRAVALKPDDAFLRIRLGLHAEFAGELEEAELHLREAARLSRKYEPRWTLANYYFRRQNEGEFWRWMREAFTMSYGDRTALFDLCWRMAPDPAVIDRSIPENRPLRLAYARYLIAKKEWEHAATVYQKLAAAASDAEVPAFLQAVERFLAARLTDTAVEIWNNLSARSLIAFNRLDPVLGPWITNPDFSVPPSGQGLDWRVQKQPGVYISLRRPDGLRIEFSGDQPEDCEILVQLLVLEAGQSYKLHSQSRLASGASSGAPAHSGLIWRVYTSTGRLLAESPDLVLEQASPVSFQAPREDGALRLVLAHQRRSGAVRMRGTIHLERVTLVLQDPVVGK